MKDPRELMHAFAENFALSSGVILFLLGLINLALSRHDYGYALVFLASGSLLLYVAWRWWPRGQERRDVP